MPTLFDKVPFLRLLLPLILGVVLQYFFFIQSWSVYLLFAGMVTMLLSCFIPSGKEFSFRWVFGIGLLLALFSFGTLSTAYRQRQSSFTFSDNKETYTGVIIDIPQQKTKTIACNLRLDGSDKKIIGYFQTGVRSKQLAVGDRVQFTAKVEPFNHVTNPDDFDYPLYMYNKGFSGLAFLYSDQWEKTGESSFSIPVLALNCREVLLNFYRSLDLGEEEFSVLSALTLGYRDNLSEDVKQSFRATGTAHVLAVSGMHVGILYASIVFIFGLIFRQRKYERFLQILVIIFIWFYAFLTGFSPSVMRAGIMITVFCLAHLFGRKGFTYNTVFIAAFLMLCYNPLFLFDVGFQLSFAAVLSICFFQPKFYSLLSVKSRFGKAVWGLFTVSLAAQLGTFPLCLYYFGTFPVYFFLTNMLVVPLVTFIFYISIFVLSVSALTVWLPDEVISIILFIPVFLLKTVISCMTAIIRFFEQLPFAQIDNIRISFIQLVLLILIMASVSFLFIKKKPRAIVYSFFFIFLWFLAELTDSLFTGKDTLTIRSQNNTSVIEWNIGRNNKTEEITSNRFIPMKEKRFLSVMKDEWHKKQVTDKFEIDYLHIVNADTISLYSLTQTFLVRSVIIDRSLSAKNRRRIIKECENLNLPYYDMQKKGIFRTNF